MAPKPRPSRSPMFAVVSLWVLCFLCVPGFLFTSISHSIDKPQGFNIEILMIYVLLILPVLALASAVGLRASQPWAWWTALASFGIPVVLGVLVLLQIVVPVFKRMMGGLVDPDWWPLSAILLVWTFPGASLLLWRNRQRATGLESGDSGHR